MEEFGVAMPDRQADINKAFGLMYFAIYSIDIESGDYLEISTLDIFREHIPPAGKNQLLFDMVVKYYVSTGYQEGMRAFLNMSTLQERLAGQNAISNEFFGTTQGWCRASFVVEKRAEDGRVLRFVYVTQEINAEIKNEQERIAELKHAYKMADTANQAKSDFLFRMSHDIRTPLNAIIGFQELILRYADDPQKVREYAGKLRTSGDLLLSFLNEILDMTKIESGSIDLVQKPFSVDPLLEDLETVIRSQAEQKQQSFLVSRLNAHGRVYLGDRVCVSRILFNLLGNAVKYTGPGGTVSLTVSEEESGDETSVLIFSVRDNGIGIPKEEQEYIFEKFQRGSGEEISRTAGTGLGLSVAKSFAQAMGGEILLKSEPGQGSLFTVRLPLRPLDADVQSADISMVERDGEQTLTGLSILVVEDNEMNLEIVTNLLALAGVHCDTAKSGQEALEKAVAHAETPYDLIAMDVQMPGMDGYETTRRLREMERQGLPHTPVIALTANAFAEDVENARRAGMDAHLAKPLNMALLKKAINDVLNRDK